MVDKPQPLRYHWIRLRASCHPTEELTRVEQAVRFVAGPDADKFPMQATALESHHGGIVQVIEVLIDKSRPVRDLLQRVLDLPGIRADLQASLEARTDDDGIFYLRLEKQDALAGRLVVTRGDDCIQVRLKLEHYPATRDAALQALARALALEKV